MSTKTFLLLNSAASGSTYGSLQDGGSVTTSTTATGWTVGTTAPTVYADQSYGSKVSSFGATAMPSAGPSNAGECWRSVNAYTGTFEPGTWKVAFAVISSAAAASGAGRLLVRLWKSADPTGVTGQVELTTATMSTAQWSNLSTSSAQNLTATQSIAATAFSGEYLFTEVACEIDTASANASADVLIRIDGSNSYVSTPYFDPALSADYLAGSPDVAVDAPGSRALSLSKASDFYYSASTLTVYKNIGVYNGAFESWTTVGAPATSNVNPNTGHTVTNLRHIVLTSI